MSYPFSVADNGWIPVWVRSDLDAGEAEELRSLMPDVSPGGCGGMGLRGLFHGAHLFADRAWIPAPPASGLTHVTTSWPPGGSTRIVWMST